MNHLQRLTNYLMKNEGTSCVIESTNEGATGMFKFPNGNTWSSTGKTTEELIANLLRGEDDA